MILPSVIERSTANIRHLQDLSIPRDDMKADVMLSVSLITQFFAKAAFGAAKELFDT